MNEAAKMAQEMGGWSDKELFLFTLVLLVGVFMSSIGYLVRRVERQGARVEGLFLEANTGRIEVAKALAASTEVTCETREQLKESGEILRRVYELRER